ncbi:MAG: Uma2 family endonuclease [Bryobacterales bacterium]|nr:Uma2 family endonuclease [Bryobacterales bacterium]MBV9401530.1 Uma2 family endonuclease [Bryobacterales bacterium]
MPTAFLEPVAPPPLESVPHRKWTVCEIEELISKGWYPGDGYELIDGELIDKKMGKNNPHVLSSKWVEEWLIAVFGFWRVHKEDPVSINERNEPEPDLTVLRVPVHELGRKPQPGDVLLVVEVAASSLAFDLSTKADLYARAGIPDYWVLDINQRRMIVHREPADGKYRSIIEYAEDENVSPLAAPQSEFRVGAAFAPTAER